MKITTVFSKRLDQLLQEDEKFRDLPILRHALSLTQYVVEMGTTQRVPNPTSPVLCPKWSQSRALFLQGMTGYVSNVIDAYRQASRVEFQIYVGRIEVVLGIGVRFYLKGKGDPFFFMTGAVDSDGIRKLEVRPIEEDGRLSSV